MEKNLFKALTCIATLFIMLMSHGHAATPELPGSYLRTKPNNNTHQSDEETEMLLALNRHTTKVEQAKTAPVAVKMEVSQTPQPHPFVVEDVKYRSASLNLKYITIGQQHQRKNTFAPTTNEGAELMEMAVKPGDIRNGCFIVFQSKKLPQRYHAQFYKWEKDPRKKAGKLALDTELTEDMVGFLKDTPNVTAHVDYFNVTQTDPNYLVLGFEEVDNRQCCGCTSCCCQCWKDSCFDCSYGCCLDILGRAAAKFKDDPVGTVSLIIDGASRIARAAAGIPSLPQL